MRVLCHQFPSATRCKGSCRENVLRVGFYGVSLAHRCSLHTGMCVGGGLQVGETGKGVTHSVLEDFPCQKVFSVT